MSLGAGTLTSNPLGQLLGESPAVAAVREQLSRLLRRQAEGARRLAPILILGETGTGKGLVAGILHRAGPRAAGPFVDVNCAAIPETLLEAELFGFERGAFTDARHAKPGLLQMAHRGVLFLDEVGLLPESLQAKLLKVLEERSVRRLGSTRSEPVDVWIIAATSEDLQAATRARRFREDLYHRLAVLTLRLPPLRERGDDILRLAEHFLGRACEDYGLTRRMLAPDARAALLAHAWPGNVREVANTMERVALLADEITVTAAMLGLPPARGRGAPGSAPADERRALAEAEAQAEQTRLLEALRATAWNLSRAAARLGIPRNTLRYRMERLGLGAAPATRSSAPRPGEAPPTGSPAEVTASRPEDSATARVDDSAPAAIRWEPRRMSFLGARLVLAGAEPGSLDVSRAMAVVLDKARSFGGEVDALSSTRLVAAFGVGAVENAPRHAASAAMAIQRTAARARLENPARPSVTVAIHTAVLPVGRHPGGHELDTDARHAALAVLEGLETCAEPGDIVVSARAAAFLTRRFELTRVGRAVAGVGEVYRLAGPADVERGLTTFVGRDAELGLLLERLGQAEAGRGQVVSIVGEPGIGKSRLLRELRRQVAGRATWMEGQAISFGRTIAFHPLIDLVRRAVGIDDGDPEAVIVEKIERAVLQLGEDLRPGLPFFRYLLAVDPGDAAILQLDPKLRRAGVFDAVRRFLARTAENRPVVAVWEDVHWADQATEEFLALLAEGVAACRILMILTHRSGYTPSVAERALHTRITLPALSSAESVAMVRGLLAADVPEALQAVLVRRAEGNPFFVEEILRSLQEGGSVQQVGDRIVVTGDLDASIVPETVQDVVLTRIQRLRDAPRRTLEVAAVIGREFGRHLVDRLAGPPDASAQALHELKAVDLIHEKSIFPETTYAFEHAVTHEVAYAAIHQARRRELHRLIGSAIEELYAERLPEHYEVLAFHFREAGERSKALEYLLKAAGKAASAFATREALALYDQALETLKESESPDLSTVMDVHGDKATLYFVLSEFDHSRAECERVLPLARQVGDRMREAKALAGIAWAAAWARDLDGAVARAREAIQVAEPIAGEAVLAQAYLTIGFVRAVSGGLEEARDAIGRALGASQSSGGMAHRSLVLSVAGLLKNWEADYVAAATLQAEGLALARRHNLLVPLLINFFLHGLTLAGKGEHERALALFREGLTFAESVGDEAIHHRLLNCLGWVHADLGDLEGAIELNRRSAEVGRRRDDPGTFPNAEVNLGDIYLAKGDLALAAEHLESAYRFWENPRTSQWMRWRYSIRLFASLGELWLARGDPGRAQQWADQCLELATRTNSRKNLVKGWRLRGDIALARRELDGAEDAFRRALTIAEAIGNPTQLWKAHAARGRLWTACRRPQEAGESYRAACAVLDHVAGRLRDPILRASLEQAPDVREIYRLARSSEGS